MRRLLGIDLAVTAENRACLSDETGAVISQHRFRLTRADLEELHASVTEGLTEGDELVVVMEPTANAWVAPAAFFGSKGATVHLVPPEQSSDLRRYYAKHVKNDRIDATLLSRLPLLHPEGLHPAQVPEGAGGTLKRLVARRSRLILEASRHRQRIRSLLALAMPEMNPALGEELGKGAIAVLGRYGDPRQILRLGPVRLTQVLIKATRGAWREAKAAEILAAARAGVELWDGLEACDFAEVAEDLAAEARLLKVLDAEIRELDVRAAGLLAELDPDGIYLSLPGFGERTATTFAGRLGDPRRFSGTAQVRSFVGVVPGTNQSGESSSRVRLTKAGDRNLRQAIYMAADAARKIDPQLAAIYHRQFVERGNHHTKAVCAVATALTTRMAVVVREGRPYVVRDTDGTPVDKAEARRIIAERSTVSEEIRRERRGTRSVQRMKGRPVGVVRSEDEPPPTTSRAPDHDATRARKGA